jgi:hypothetical protein
VKSTTITITTTVTTDRGLAGTDDLSAPVQRGNTGPCERRIDAPAITGL